MRKNYYDICILTIISSEFKAILDALNFSEKDSFVDNGSMFYEANIETLTGSVSVIIHCVGEAGNDYAANATSKMIERFHPNMIILMGIAAGIKGKCKIGDVFVPRKVIDHTSKVVENGVFHGRPEIFKPPHKANQMLMNFNLDNDIWRDAYKNIFPIPVSPTLNKEVEFKDNVSDYPTLYDSGLASANILLRDPNFLKNIRDTEHQQVKVGDMEAAGFVKASEQRDPIIPWIIVRAVSDFGDDFKNDSFHLQAACAAASYVRMFILYGYNRKFFSNESKSSELRKKTDIEINKTSKNLIKAIKTGVGSLTQPLLHRLKSYLDDRSYYSNISKHTKSVGLVTTESIERIEAIDSSDMDKNYKDILTRTVLYNHEKLYQGQLKREMVSALAIEQAQSTSSEKTVEQDIDDDWLSLFWECAERTTKDDVQKVFASILASESEEPGAISRKTLQILSVMDSIDYLSFQHACSVSLTDKNGTAYLMASTTDYENDELNNSLLNPQDEFHLSSLGLVTSVQSQIFDKDTDAYMFIGKEKYTINIISDELFNENEELSYLFYVFSPVGEELKECISHKVVDEFVNGIRDFFLIRLGVELIKC